VPEQVIDFLHGRRDGRLAGLPSARGKAPPWAGAGLLSWFVPPVLAGEVAREAAAERDAGLAAAGSKVPRRRARLLPPWLAVYFTLALCLLARLPCQDALRSLAGDGAAGLAVPVRGRGPARAGP
jgi:Insertion element 4 transposase N-terminal